MVFEDAVAHGFLISSLKVLVLRCVDLHCCWFVSRVSDWAGELFLGGKCWKTRRVSIHI